MPQPRGDLTPASASSLHDLRVQMLQRAAMFAARARTCRARGDVATARVLERRAASLTEVARSVRIS